MRDYLEYLRIPYSEKSDCYALVRKFYLREFKILLGEYDYPVDWAKTDPEMIFDHYRKEGFSRTRTLKFDYGNVILFKVNGFFQHLGIVIEDGFFLHTTHSGTAIHPHTHGYWYTKIAATFRHNSRSNH